LTLLQAASSNVSLPQFNTETEEYNVYSAVLRRLHRPPANKSMMIVNHSLSPVDHDLLFDKSNRDEPFPSIITLTNYIKVNKQAREISDEFDTEYKHAMLSKKELEDIFKDGCCGWNLFYERYPGSSGYVSFSRVGFNGNATQALVYVVCVCGGLCGTGGYVLLEKKGGTWRTQRWLASWIS